jgi:hypothetical protein
MSERMAKMHLADPRSTHLGKYEASEKATYHIQVKTIRDSLVNPIQTSGDSEDREP